MKNGSPIFWRRGLLPVLGCLIMGLLLTGCQRKFPPTVDTGPPVVSVALPIEKEVTDYADFTGRTAPVESVEVRARVWGYLDKVNFEEGKLVKKGDVLFEIDPRVYEASFKQAEGNLQSLQARLARLDSDLARAQKLIASKTIAQEDYDKIVGDRGEAAASIEGLKAAVERARLDLSFTKVTAPISGRVSRYNVTVGNLVQSGEQGGGTLLTTIVSVDPIYVYFDVDELTVLHVRKMIHDGRSKSARDVNIPVYMGMADEQGNPHQGTINFVDNRVDSQTGTLRVRAVFDNDEEVFSPGLFARVRVPIGNKHQSLLISDRAIDTDQGQKIVYAVNEKNEVVTRPVTLGARHHGLRAIESGLKADEKVVVVGLQQVRPGLVVEPKLVDMPTGPEVTPHVQAGTPQEVPATPQQKR